MSKPTVGEEIVWKRHHGLVIQVRGGRVYTALPAGMAAACDNRMPCPHCETNVVEYYTYIWANGFGCERRYFCPCDAVFQVRHDTRGSWFVIMPWKINRRCKSE